MKIKLDTEMPFEIKFSVSKGEPRTRWDPGCPAECEIESITMFDVELTAEQEEKFIKEYGSGLLEEACFEHAEMLEIEQQMRHEEAIAEKRKGLRL